MRKTGIVFKRDLAEIVRARAFLVICIIFLVAAAAISVTASIMISRREWLMLAPARPLLELIIGLISYFIPLIILMAFIWGYSSLPVIKEKANGNITSLVATTLTPEQVWMGKSLAIFLPGYALSVFTTLTVITSINLSAIVPAGLDFLYPLPLFLVSLVWNPLLLLGTLLFIMLFSLAGNPDIAISPSFIVGFGLMMGIPLGMVLEKVDLVSWSFSLWYLAGTAAVLIAVFILTRFLTRERIVLSSKGS